MSNRKVYVVIGDGLITPLSDAELLLQGNPGRSEILEARKLIRRALKAAVRVPTSFWADAPSGGSFALTNPRGKK